MTRTGTIYLIDFTYGKFEQYVGQTYRDVKTRIAGHKCADMPVDRKMKAHPDDYFVTIIEDGIPLDQLNEKEMYYISSLGTHVRNGGLNMTTGGQKNSIYSLESRKKISEKMKEYLAKHGTQRLRDMHRGTHHTEEAKKKMSEAKLGKKQDPEVIAKRTEKIKKIWQTPGYKEHISAMFSGEGNPFYGKKHDDTARKKMSEAKLKHWQKLKEAQLQKYLDWEWLMTQNINTPFPVL